MQELVSALNEIISEAKTEKHPYPKDEGACDADLAWEASRFFATLIHKAEPLGLYKSFEQYEDFKERYQNSNNILIDDATLFQQCWLRNILGFVEVTGGVSSLCFRFNEISEYKNEILFWLEFQQNHEKSGKRTVEKNHIESAVELYERQYHMQLDRKGVFFNKWTSTKEGLIEYADFQVYFKQYIDHWDDFAFISAYEQFKENIDVKTLMVKREDLDELHKSFKLLFPQIPSIRAFIEQKVITETDVHYQIGFYNTEPGYWSALKDKIGGLLWELIISDDTYADDTQRLKTWLTKLLYWPMWPDPFLYMTGNSATRFLNTAFDLVMTDTDIKGSKDEFRKVCLDSRLRYDSLLPLERAINSGEFTLNTTDHYELLTSFNRWEKKASITYLYGQDSRNLLTYLIKSIVKYDDEYSQKSQPDSAPDTKINYHRVIRLLESGLQKPFLLWETTRFIIKDRPVIIPYLIMEKGLESVAFLLLDDLDFFASQKQMMNIELWKQSTALFLLQLPKQDKWQAANKIFQVYRSLNNNKYEIPYNRSNTKREQETQEQHRTKELLVLGLLEDSRLHPYMTNHRQSEYLLPALYPELATIIMEYSSQPLYNNGTVQFPILQWDAMCWLLKISTYWKYHDQKGPMSETIGHLTKEFLNRYLKSIEVTEIKKYNHFEEKEELGIPLWSEKIERLHFIEWIYPIYFIHANGLLNQFLSPRIDIEQTPDRYHEKNKFSADKLRTHIGVLLQVLRNLLQPVLPYGFEKNEIHIIKKKIESQIIDFLRIHIKDDPIRGKIDLFDFNREWRFQVSDKEALFPQIARAINWFSNRDTIINTISETGDISKLLTLLDLVKSEGVKQKLIKKIQGLNIQTFLENYNWIPEIQHAVTNLSSHPELLPQIEKAIEFWRQEVMTRRDKKEYQLVLYKAELLAAYFKNSETQLDAISEPVLNYQSPSELRPADYKQFYKGLLCIQTGPAKSHTIFNALVKQYPEYPSFALNRMVAKINLAMTTNEITLYQEALEEWKEVESDITDNTLDYLEPELSENVMTVLSKTGDYDQLDTRYKSLDLPNRMKPAVLEIMVQSLIDQKKFAQALQLVSSAKTYHQFSDITDIRFIEDFEKRISQVDDIDELKNHYARIFNTEPGKLIRIFPKNLNGQLELNQFIVKEIILAADKLLEKIKSIEEIKDENKYNDLMELLLDTRINPWGWQVGDQSRGAYSGIGGKQPGERDLPIMNRYKRVMMVCEAFIYRNPASVKSHLEKIFNYHHQREAFTLLVYDLSENPGVFESNWKKYSDEILPSTTYPTGFEITGAVTEISNKLGYSKSAIKVCMSEHGSGTILYHIFVNLHYRVTVS